jgi:hypothetical protein
MMDGNPWLVVVEELVHIQVTMDSLRKVVAMVLLATEELSWHGIFA